MEMVRADENGLKAAVSVMKNGGLVVYPTDTLYGIGAALSEKEAILRVFQLKEMQPAPISLIMSGIEMISEYAKLSNIVRRFFEIFPAGPFTFLLPVRENHRKIFPDFMIENDLIGIRVPFHDFPRKLAEQIGPLTSTSANRHGACAPGDFGKVELKGADLYVDDGPSLYDKPSTILKEKKNGLGIVREGALEYKVIEKYMGEYLG